MSHFSQLMLENDCVYIYILFQTSVFVDFFIFPIVCFIDIVLLIAKRTCKINKLLTDEELDENFICSLLIVYFLLPSF
jgi:hypothetical protein